MLTPFATDPAFCKDCDQADAFAAELALLDDLAAPAACDDDDRCEARVVWFAEAIYLVSAKRGFALTSGPSGIAVLVSLRVEGRESVCERLRVAGGVQVWLLLARFWAPLFQHLQVPW